MMFAMEFNILMVKHEQKSSFAHNTIIASGGVGSLYKYHIKFNCKC